MLTDNTKANAAFKRTFGRAHTSPRELYNESIPSNFQMHAKDIFAQHIDSTPSQAVADGVAEFVVFELVLDHTSNGKAYICRFPASHPNYGGSFLYESGVHIIPQSFGEDYRAILKDNGTEVAPSAAEDWFLDSFSGVITSEDDLNLGTTGTLDAYIYIGLNISDYLGATGISGGSGVTGPQGVTGPSGLFYPGQGLYNTIVNTWTPTTNGLYYHDIQHDLDRDDLIVEAWNTANNLKMDLSGVEKLSNDILRLYTDDPNLEVQVVINSGIQGETGIQGTTGLSGIGVTGAQGVTGPMGYYFPGQGLFEELVETWTPTAHGLYYYDLEHNLDRLDLIVEAWNQDNSLLINLSAIERLDSNTLRLYVDNQSLRAHIIVNAGIVGSTGSQGPTGPSGFGATGLIGSTGLVGTTGIQGVTGPAIEGLPLYATVVDTWLPSTNGLYYWDIDHNLGTQDIQIDSFYNDNNIRVLLGGVDILSDNTIRVYTTNPSSEIRVIIDGSGGGSGGSATALPGPTGIQGATGYNSLQSGEGLSFAQLETNDDQYTLIDRIDIEDNETIYVDCKAMGSACNMGASYHADFDGSFKRPYGGNILEAGNPSYRIIERTSEDIDFVAETNIALNSIDLKVKGLPSTKMNWRLWSHTYRNPGCVMSSSSSSSTSTSSSSTSASSSSMGFAPGIPVDASTDYSFIFYLSSYPSDGNYFGADGRTWSGAPDLIESTDGGSTWNRLTAYTLFYQIYLDYSTTAETEWSGTQQQTRPIGTNAGTQYGAGATFNLANSGNITGIAIAGNFTGSVTSTDFVCEVHSGTNPNGMFTLIGYSYGEFVAIDSTWYGIINGFYPLSSSSSSSSSMTI